MPDTVSDTVRRLADAHRSRARQLDEVADELHQLAAKLSEGSGRTRVVRAALGFAVAELRASASDARYIADQYQVAP